MWHKRSYRNVSRYKIGFVTKHGESNKPCAAHAFCLFTITALNSRNILLTKYRDNDKNWTADYPEWLTLQGLQPTIINSNSQFFFRNYFCRLFFFISLDNNIPYSLVTLRGMKRPLCPQDMRPGGCGSVNRLAKCSHRVKITEPKRTRVN